MIRNWKVIIVIQIAIFVLLSVLLFPSELSDPASIRVVDSMEEDENLPLLRVADDYNYPPYSYLDESGNPSGYNIELIRALADVMGYQFDLQLMPWPDVMEGLEKGEIDLTSGMFYSDERANTYVFSTKHSLSCGDIFTVWGNEISSLEELRGKSVAVLRDDVMEDYLRGQALDINLVQVVFFC
jgi:ABC-type amino acid transport substrate-binding protein